MVIANRERVNSPTARTVASIRRLDPRHLLVAEAEMMADLVDQHMTHEAREILPGLAPVVEDRPAVEKDHVELRPRIARALPGQGDAAVETEDVEWALQRHFRLG